jgi:hypothetical protein
MIFALAGDPRCILGQLGQLKGADCHNQVACRSPAKIEYAVVLHAVSNDFELIPEGAVSLTATCLR